MTWGKAIPKWWSVGLPTGADATPTPTSAADRLQLALDLLIHLNDSFALDGGAPPSYGGLLWCLGWRNRPGTAEKPKARPTSTLGRRIKPGDLERQVTKQHKHIQTHIHAQSRTQHLIPNTQYPAHKR